MNLSELTFICEGSIRYHRCRAEHFAARAKWLTIASIFLGTGVVVSVLLPYPGATATVGILVALINTYRLVAKPDDAARAHEKWCRQWSELLAEIQSNPNPTNRQLATWIERTNDLNSECLEDMKAVKAYVYNQTMTALGRSGTPYTLTRFQKWTKHWLPHTHGFDDQNLAG